MNRRVVGFILISLALVGGLLGLGNSTRIPPRAGVAYWLSNAEVFPQRRLAPVTDADRYRCMSESFSSVGNYFENCLAASQTAYSRGFPASLYFGGLLALALVGVGLIVFARRT